MDDTPYKVTSIGTALKLYNAQFISGKEKKQSNLFEQSRVKPFEIKTSTVLRAREYSK